MIWSACDGSRHIQPLAGKLYRLVESQEQVATLGYVDTLEEQALLEELLDGVKPAYPAGAVEDDFHYLLKSPFRYAPLKWGSRFGRIHEPSIFYGGGSVEVALAESAYYRFVFWSSMAAPPPKDRICTEHTLFSALYRTSRGLRLQEEPFVAYLPELTHPADYRQSQRLGTDMREAGVEAFEYPSARDPARGLCVGLFTLGAFPRKRPQEMSQWLCEVGGRGVAFKQVGSRAIISFLLDLFLVDDRLPLPA